MGRKPNNYNHVIHLLQELHTLYPTFNMGRHLSTALSDYNDFWGISDKELLFALQKYKAKLEMDVPYTEGEELEKILKDGMYLSLSDVLGEDEDED